MNCLIYLSDKLAGLFARIFDRNGVTTTIVGEYTLLKEELFSSIPSIVVMHCHTIGMESGRDFDKIKELTHYIRSKSPQTIIVIQHTGDNRLSSDYWGDHLADMEGGFFVSVLTQKLTDDIISKAKSNFL